MYNMYVHTFIDRQMSQLHVREYFKENYFVILSTKNLHKFVKYIIFKKIVKVLSVTLFQNILIL